MDKKQLLELKEQIDEAKDEVNRLEGRKEHLMQELKDEWDCGSVEEAEELLEELEQEITEIETKIKKGTRKLEKKYEFE